MRMVLAGYFNGEKNADRTMLDSSYVDANGIVQTVHYIPDALGYTHLEPPAWEVAPEVVKVENKTRRK